MISQMRASPINFLCTTKEVLALYVGRKYTKFTGDLVQAVKDLQLTDPAPPDEPDDAANAVQLKQWELVEKTHQSKMESYADFCASLYGVVLGQCTETIRSNWRHAPNWLVQVKTESHCS
jgi:hypothetical protein